MKVLVTGASGFIGKNLVKYLSKKNYEIFACYFKKKPIIKAKNIHWIKFDITRNNSFKKIFLISPDIIIHLIWYGIPDFSLKNSKKNFNYSLEFFKQVFKINNLKKVIITGSCYEYYNSRIKEKMKINHFVNAKKKLRKKVYKLAKINNKIFIWLRIFFVYGPWQRKNSLIYYLIKNLKNNIRPVIKKPNNLNDFIHIDDVCLAVEKAIIQSKTSSFFDIGSGKLTSVLKIYKFLEFKIRGDNSFYLNLIKKYHKIKMNRDIVAKKKKFYLLKWKPKINIYKGLEKTLNDYNQNTL
jgi:nucleoside-diphosphate-sugar epimerase